MTILLKHRPLKVGHPCLLPLQQTWWRTTIKCQNILATIKGQDILAPTFKFHQNILAPTLKFHQNILAPTLKFQIFWHLPSNFKYFGTYPQIPGPALICSRKPPDKHRKEWKSFWNNNSLWVGFNTAWWYFPPSPSFNMMTHTMDNLAVDILPGCVFHNCNFDICHETTDKYKNQKMKIRVSWDGQSPPPWQLTSSPRNWHPPWQGGRSRRGTRWRSRSWCSRRPPQIDAGLVPDKILSKWSDFAWFQFDFRKGKIGLR